ncbi:hypothetical protein RJ640_012376 [Escallonia rubra]|uniref:Uncharacterized protein n=1 Tax=Escallonia rubra TaxID=112253 RepID=A0AA88R4U6_9ASTE|nr:hypothetical protein RJ640_012376 [Escallonia rubra]
MGGGVCCSPSSKCSSGINRRIRAPSASAAAGAGCSWAELWRRCVEVVKQHKTRLYILRRCVSMLLCWRAHAIRINVYISPVITAATSCRRHLGLAGPAQGEADLIAGYDFPLADIDVGLALDLLDLGGLDEKQAMAMEGACFFHFSFLVTEVLKQDKLEIFYPPNKGVKAEQYAIQCSHKLPEKNPFVKRGGANRMGETEAGADHLEALTSRDTKFHRRSYTHTCLVLHPSTDPIRTKKPSLPPKRGMITEQIVEGIADTVASAAAKTAKAVCSMWKGGGSGASSGSASPPTSGYNTDGVTLSCVVILRFIGNKFRIAQNILGSASVIPSYKSRKEQSALEARNPDLSSKVVAMRQQENVIHSPS